MKLYKGVSKDLKGYGGFQYEVGKTYEQENPSLCNSGFHACEAPMDVLRHYGLKDGNRYFEAELEGVTEERQNDTKRVGSKVTLGAEIGIAGLIKAQIQYTREKAKRGTAGGNRSNLAGGDDSLIVGGNKSKAKAGIGSVIVLVNREWSGDRYKIIDWKAGLVDGETLKPDTWYKLENGEFVEAE